MNARVHKWGNSLAIRIPRAMANGLGVHEHSLVSVELQEGRLTVTPIVPDVSLSALVNAITDENLHGEVDLGPPQGREPW